MNAGFAWMIAGLVLCGAELLQSGVFLLWIGLAAGAAGGVISLAQLAFPWQVGTFLVCLGVFLAIPLLLRRRQRPEDGGVNAPTSGLVGKTCRALAFDGLEGRVSFRDGTWAARVFAAPTPAPGTVLRVVGLDGTTLLVAPDRS